MKELSRGMKLNELQLSLTNKCRINCAHCHVEKGNRMMSSETLRKCAEQAKKSGVGWIRLTGGDVFEHEKLEEAIEYLKSEGLKIILNIASERIQRALKLDYDLLLVSFKNIDEIKNNKKTLKEKAESTMGCIVFRKEWLKRLKELSRLADEINLNSLFFLRDTGAKTREYFMQLNECIERTLQMTKKITFANAFPMCLVAEQNIKYCAGGRFDNGNERLYITEEGAIKPSAYSNTILGDISKTTLKEALNENQKRAQKIYGAKCLNCSLKEYCGGGITGNKEDLLIKHSFENPHLTKLQEKIKKNSTEIEKTYFENSDFFMRYIPFEKMKTKKIKIKQPKEACIYVHFPYCANNCGFCRIKKIKTGMKEYTDELIKEINENEMITKCKIKAVYFGGGSPQLMGKENAEKIFNCLAGRIKNTPEEISFELFPSDYDKELMKFLEGRATRISIGVQCLNDRILKSTGRKTERKKIIEFVKKARAEGFKKINLDVIYGLFSECPEEFAQDFNEILGLKPDSVTIQPLHFSSGKNGEMLNETARKMLSENDYEQVSAEDFSKYGLFEYQKCLLNSGNIIGIGRGSFSQINGVHTRTDENGKKTFHKETAAEKIYGKLFFGARLMKLSIKEIDKKFGISFKACFSDSLRLLLRKKFAEIKNDEFIITEKGKAYTDLIANIITLNNEDYKK
jgi:radical SAM protein with 4Fe4S-binding SPASM domain